MSDLNPKGTVIELGGKEYKLLFTLNAIDEIQDKFDISISQLPELLKDDRKMFKILKYLIALLINEGLDDNEKGEAHVDERWVGRKITAENISSLQGGVLKAFTAGAPKSDEEEIPNVTSE